MASLDPKIKTLSMLFVDIISLKEMFLRVRNKERMEPRESNQELTYP